jgi:hypothetical protein
MSIAGLAWDAGFLPVGAAGDAAKRMRRLEETLGTFLRCYRNGRNGLGLVVMYGNTRQPPGNSNDYEIGKVAIGAATIHRLAIVATSPRTSSNHIVWARPLAHCPQPFARYQRTRAGLPRAV